MLPVAPSEQRKKLAVDCFNESKAIVESLGGEETAEFTKVLTNMTPAI
jgi:hypothetical protein